MLPQSYKISHGLCLNNLLQVLLIGNQRYKVPRSYISIIMMGCLIWSEEGKC